MGLGWVGGTAYKYFMQETDHEIFIYDMSGRGSLKELNEANIIFISLPTPYIEGKGYDDTAIRTGLKNISNDKIVVIRSTILPGTTTELQELYPDKCILFNPEFLREQHAYADFCKPHRQIIGIPIDVKQWHEAADIVHSILPSAPTRFTVDAKIAEMVKYFSNTFLSTKVIFANQLYDICEASGISYNTVRTISGLDPRIGTSHFGVFDDGYRGYGGHCLPKDTKALIEYSKRLNTDTQFLDTLENINNKLINK